MYNYYPEDLIEEIRINNDIVDVVSDYVKLERRAKYYFGLCPFHKEKTPSFSVTPSKQIFYCYGCGKGGNVIQFIMDIEHIGYIDAIKYLADRVSIQLPEGHSAEEIEKAKVKQELLSINVEAARFFFTQLNSVEGEKARQYLKRRNITEQVARKFGVGYSSNDWRQLYNHLKSKGFNEELIIKSGLSIKGKSNNYYDRFRGRVMFPIFDIRGNVIGFGGRVLDSSLPKYMNSPESLVYNKGRNLYALNFAKNAGSRKLIIVEGYMDVISLHQCGIINSVASLGTALTESQGRILKKYAEEIIICYDSDTAGQAATMRGLDLLSDIGCNVKVLALPEGKDPDDFLKNNSVDDFRKLADNAVSLVEYKIRILKSKIDTNTTEGKIKFLNKAADILSKLDNSVEKEMYIRKIADKYRVTHEALFSEVYKRSKPRNSRKPAIFKDGAYRQKAEKQRIAENSNRLVHDERFILSILCVDNSIYKWIKDKISVECFTDAENRRIAEIILSRLENNKGIVPGELLNILEGQTANDFAKIFNTECHCDDNRKAILGKIRSIELYRIKKRQKQILELLKDESSLPEGDVEKLKQELKSLIIRIKNQKSI
jgi:DNA primase